VDRRTVECVTGMLDGDGEFASHGHAIRLRMILREVGTGAPRPSVPSQRAPQHLQCCGIVLHHRLQPSNAVSSNSSLGWLPRP
jgi:hypothetical protein